MSQALCFHCGARKKQATAFCGKCQRGPKSFDELVLSYCLSLECIKPKSLETCREYFKQKKRPPKFRPAIVDLAIQLAEKHGGRDDQSIEFSSAMFDFTDLDAEDEPISRRRTITAHIIGRKQGAKDDEAPIGVNSKTKTYHTETWYVGRDISEEQVKLNQDGDQIFVWYRWLNDRWTWSCVSRGKFAQLKSVEDGNPF